MKREAGESLVCSRYAIPGEHSEEIDRGVALGEPRKTPATGPGFQKLKPYSPSGEVFRPVTSQMDRERESYILSLGPSFTLQSKAKFNSHERSLKSRNL